jgi:OmpR family response regulator RpaB
LQKKILLIDNEINIHQILNVHFPISSYVFFNAKDKKEAVKIFREERPDLIILDTVQQELDSYEIYNTIKRESNIPVIILTSNISSRIIGLEFGANDYLAKPFSGKELKGKIKKVLEYADQINHTTKKYLLYISDLIIDTNKKQIFKSGKKIHLTKIEFSLIELLIKNAGKKVSRIYILNDIWDYRPIHYTDTRIVDVHISRLRTKIENNPTKPNLILTVRGAGYMFQYPKKI